MWMIKLMLNLIFIVLAVFSIYFLVLGRKYEDDVNKGALSFMLLGLVFFILYNLSLVYDFFGFGSNLLSTNARMLFSLLVPISFIVGIGYLKK
jgi:cytochrome c oxidase assembly factor CtaG